MGKVIPVHEEDGSTKLDVIDALDAEIDTVWALIAALQTIFTEHDGDPHIKGALRLANSHLDALAAIRRDLDRLGQSARRIAANIAKLPDVLRTQD